MLQNEFITRSSTRHCSLPSKFPWLLTGEVVEVHVVEAHVAVLTARREAAAFREGRGASMLSTVPVMLLSADVVADNSHCMP